MIVVTKVEVAEVPRPEWVFAETEEGLFPLFHPDRGGDAPCSRVQRQREILIHGREYYFGDRGFRKRLMIGWHPQVHEALRIPVEVMDNMQGSIDELLRKEEESQYRISCLQSIIDRLKHREILFRRFLGVLQ